MTATAAQATWPDLLSTLVRGEDLAPAQTGWAMDEIMRGDASPARVAGLLVALRAKGETVEELTGLADAMLAHAERFTVPVRSVDVVGTGGDRAHTVNISTMAALVVAGAGVTVVKHGNRAASSASGTADVLEALGLPLGLPPAAVARVAEEVGITFCFAQVFHPAMRHAAVARRELGIPTAFNILGPLTNPAQPEAAAVGVADPAMAGLVAGVLAGRGTSALVFRSDDGLDELAPTSTAHVWQVQDGQVVEHVLDPVRELGIPAATVAQLRGGDAAHNASVVRTLLAGEPGPVRDTVVLNAAAALVADGTLPGTAAADGGLVQRLAAGQEHARRSLDTGAAADVLARWLAASAALAG